MGAACGGRDRGQPGGCPWTGEKMLKHHTDAGSRTGGGAALDLAERARGRSRRPQGLESPGTRLRRDGRRRRRAGRPLAADRAPARRAARVAPPAPRRLHGRPVHPRLGEPRARAGVAERPPATYTEGDPGQPVRCGTRSGSSGWSRIKRHRLDLAGHTDQEGGRSRRNGAQYGPPSGRRIRV